MIQSVECLLSMSSLLNSEVKAGMENMWNDYLAIRNVKGSITSGRDYLTFLTRGILLSEQER